MHPASILAIHVSEKPAATASWRWVSPTAMRRARSVSDSPAGVVIVVIVSTQSQVTCEIPITDVAPLDGPTAKDNALVSDVQAVRELLLRRHAPIGFALGPFPPFQQRLRDLAAIRPTPRPRPLAAGLPYWSAVERLSRAVDGLWDGAEIDGLAGEVAAGRTFLGDTVATRIPNGIGIACGRLGQPRHQSPSTIAFVARALELRCAGLAPSAADEQVADESYGVRDRQTVAVYRKRIRDRLGW
jgi:hypothetical protein